MKIGKLSPTAQTWIVKIRNWHWTGKARNSTTDLCLLLSVLYGMIIQLLSDYVTFQVISEKDTNRILLSILPQHERSLKPLLAQQSLYNLVLMWIQEQKTLLKAETDCTTDHELIKQGLKWQLCYMQTRLISTHKKHKSQNVVKYNSWHQPTFRTLQCSI